MKKKQWKLFVDYEKEEKWLNKKVADGLAMTHYSLGLYTFESCSQGEYIYRIELLKNRVSHPDSLRYIQFMEDSGAKHIATHLNWVYFRKSSIEGPFEVYSDLDSRILHYQRIVRLWVFIGSLILFAILSQIPSIVDIFENDFQNVSYYITFNSILGAFLLLDMVLFFRFLPRYVKIVKTLKRERDIRE